MPANESLGCLAAISAARKISGSAISTTWALRPAISTPIVVLMRRRGAYYLHHNRNSDGEWIVAPVRSA
jgi:hypothetical protein